MTEHADADRRLFVVNDEQWEALNSALDRPAVLKPRLAELLKDRAAAVEQYVLDITWDCSGLPQLVGTFSTRKEADDWAAINIPNGSWNVCPVARPYEAVRRD